MNLDESRRANTWNLNKLATYLSVDPAVMLGYYEELRGDEQLIADLNERLQSVRRDHGITLGIFTRESVDTVDWFAFERILLYVLVRHLRPSHCLETGVFYGGNTAFVLAGLAKNDHGRLVSIDLPDSAIRAAGDPRLARHPLVGDSEYYDEGLLPGFIIPERLKSRWDLVLGDSLTEIPKRPETFDLYLHDSDHSMSFLRAEMERARARLSLDGTVVVDDIDWSNGFYEFCVRHRLKPMLFTDNGKDDLRVRIGVACLNHADNSEPAMTGDPA